MNSERFRVRGYDVFLLQGWLNRRVLSEFKYVTCDVTSFLIHPLPYTPFFLSKHWGSCRLFLSSHIFSGDTTALHSPHPLLYPPATSYLFICPPYKPSLSSIFFLFCHGSEASCCLSNTARLNLQKRKIPCWFAHYHIRRPHLGRVSVQAWLYTSHTKKGKQRGGIHKAWQKSLIYNHCGILLFKLEHKDLRSAQTPAACSSSRSECCDKGELRGGQRGVKVISQWQSLLISDISCLEFSPYRQRLIQSCHSTSSPPVKWLCSGSANPQEDARICKQAGKVFSQTLATRQSPGEGFRDLFAMITTGGEKKTKTPTPSDLSSSIIHDCMIY